MTNKQANFFINRIWWLDSPHLTANFFALALWMAYNDKLTTDFSFTVVNACSYSCQVQYLLWIFDKNLNLITPYNFIVTWNIPYKTNFKTYYYVLEKEVSRFWNEYRDDKSEYIIYLDFFESVVSC